MLAMNVNLDEIYVEVDDFFQRVSPKWFAWLKYQAFKKRIRPTKMSESEIITIIILFHLSHYRDFKNFYCIYVCHSLKQAFPTRVSYSQIVRLVHHVTPLLSAFLSSRLATSTGISFIDSTSIKVCHNRRIMRNKVFLGLAKRGKTTMGWFYGFKLHLVINDVGELVNVALTTGDIDDRVPVPTLTQGLMGSIYGDKGYLSGSLYAMLKEKGIRLITNVRRNMKQQGLSGWDKLMLQRRFLIETVNNMLKNVCQIEHSRHRHPIGFLANLSAGLIAYTFLNNKPTVGIIRC